MPADLCDTFNTLEVFALASSLIPVTRYSTRGPWMEELFILAHVSVHHGKEGRVEFMKAGACGRVWSHVGRSGDREVEPESEAGTALQGLPPEAHIGYLDHRPDSSMTTRESTIPGGSPSCLGKLRGHRNISVSCSYTVMVVGIITTSRM